MFTKILVANRGQIAIRVMHTCQELGIRTVGVFSQEDRQSPHVFVADEAYDLGEGEENYADVGALLRIANKSKVDAIHPGYGLLSEAPSFADACAEQKIPLIGPSRKIIEEALHRRKIREIAKNLGIQSVPEGKISENSSISEVKEKAKELGYPVLLKPASKSGRGMRAVYIEEELEITFLNEARENFSHFGNRDILLEKLLPKVRYLEVIVARDHQGKTLVFPEIDGSIQRNRRPLIEESPAYGLSDRIRDDLRQYSRALSDAVGYVGVSNFQYLFDTQEKQIYFLEMSTELGIGHTATELVTGCDLVEWQIRLAKGEPLTFKYDYLRPKGVSFACRIAAEDPTREFTATTGKVIKLSEARGAGVRVDSGLYENQPIPLLGDPILAQLSVHAYSRERALARVHRALFSTVILGVENNLPFLEELVNHEDLANRPVYTRWVRDCFDGWEPREPPKDVLLAITAADALHDDKDGVYSYRVGPTLFEVGVKHQGKKQFQLSIDGKTTVVQIDPFTSGSVRVMKPVQPGKDIWADYALGDKARYISVEGRSYHFVREK